MISAIAPPAITIAGRHESRTSERSHPLTKAIMYPPTKVVCQRTRCLVLISFSSTNLESSQPAFRRSPSNTTPLQYTNTKSEQIHHQVHTQLSCTIDWAVRLLSLS
ncbi:hypothetical protein Pint_10092 [Pistacia integerrima]|uniref:Uncharacterized protein n=1 Tax=Pistacia integerrima TaxID=434235 RepID=A0ACC0XFS8_9ROSI|nr:hypothetical protein Pint_10092 [Pistacia integerrima]